MPDLFRIVRRLRRTGGPAQLDMAGLLVLHRLAHDEPRRPSDLANDLALDLSTVSRHVRTLESAGLVLREADPDDGRSFRVRVTEQGTDLLVESLDRREQAVERVLDSWDTDDVEQLRRLLTRLADDLENIDEETR